MMHPALSDPRGHRATAAEALRLKLLEPSRRLASRHGWARARRRIVGAVAAAARRLPAETASRRDALGDLGRELASFFARLPASDPDLRGFLVAVAAEATLPAAARSAQGAVYTDASLARFTLDQGLRALDGPPRRVLDPACGAGAFLAAAALRLPQDDLELVGIDRDRAALDAARARMALLAESATLARWTLRAGDALRRPPAPRFDLVIGNPPYVRQEAMGGAAAKRALSARLERALPGAAAAIAPRADLAVAFLLLGLASLREGGALAYVTTNAWLDAVYGRPLRRFLAERAEVRFVAEWEGKVFSGAAANPVVAVIRRSVDGGRRKAVFASYARTARRRRVDRAGLASLDRWGATLLRGADLLEEIIARAPAAFAPLGEIAALHYGTKPGLVDFFVLDAEDTEVEERFLLPALTSTAEIDTLALRPRDLPRRLFVCPLSRQELLRGSFPGARAHVLASERLRTRQKARHTRAGLPYPEVASVRGNTPWYSLRPRPPGDFAIPLLIRERHAIVHACEPMLATNMFYQGRFSDRALALPGTAILNSTLAQLAVESLGRINIGGRINVYGPELRALRVPDPRRMDRSSLGAIARAFEPLRRRGVGPVSRESGEADRRALDVAVLEAAGVEGRYAPLLAEAITARVSGRLRRESSGKGARGAAGPPLAGPGPLL